MAVPPRMDLGRRMHRGKEFLEVQSDSASDRKAALLGLGGLGSGIIWDHVQHLQIYPMLQSPNVLVPPAISHLLSPFLQQRCCHVPVPLLARAEPHVITVPRHETYRNRTEVECETSLAVALLERKTHILSDPMILQHNGDGVQNSVSELVTAHACKARCNFFKDICPHVARWISI